MIILEKGITKLLLLVALNKQEPAYGEKLLWKLVRARPDSAPRVMKEMDYKHSYPLLQSRRLLPAMVAAKDATNFYFVMQEFFKADRKEEVLARHLSTICQRLSCKKRERRMSGQNVRSGQRN